LEETCDASLAGDNRNCVEEAAHSRVGALAVIDSIAVRTKWQSLKRDLYNVVLILSNGVTANSDSVTPAPKPAMTVLGPEIFPSASCNIDLY